MKHALFFGLFFLWTGCGFTKITHPEVEVLDPVSKKFIVEEVSVLSKCGSCHEHLTDKYAVYSKTVKNKTSLDKLNLLRSDLFSGAELQGYENYVESDFGFYYFYPWWYDDYIVNSGFYNSVPATSDEELTDVRRRRQSYRRGTGRLRLSSSVTPTVTAPAPSVTPITPPTSVVNSPSNTTPNESASPNPRRTTDSSPISEPRSQQNDAAPLQEKRDVGRSR